MLDTGTQIDRFTIERVLGQGGMAVVYLVTHHTLGSEHALKVLTVGSKAITERMLQEGRVQAQLRHPHIVAVHDVLDVAGQPGLLMEYVDGPSLEDFIIRKPTIELDLARHLFMGTVSAVAHAHEKGLIHRDLKPGNILLQMSAGQWIPKVTDFGLAKMMEGSENLSKTRSGVAMGTPSYMSPEQIRDAKNVDQRTDVFALGCILYELFTGAQAFYGEDILEVFNKVAEGAYTPPRELRPDLPDDVEAAIRGALETDRNARIPDCTTLREVLNGGSRGQAWRELGPRAVKPAAPAFSATSLNPPEDVGHAQQPTVIRQRPHVSADTLLQTDPTSSHPPLTELGISRTTMGSQPPPAQSPLAWVVGGGLLVMVAMGAGVAGTMAMLQPQGAAVVQPVEAPEPTPKPSEPVVPAPSPVEPAPVPAPVVEPAPAPSPEPVVEPVPAPAPRPAAAPTTAGLARKWMGVAGNGDRFVLEIDSQRGSSFTATGFVRGRQMALSGRATGDDVVFSGDGWSFTGRKTSRGGWQGTFTRGGGTARAQWFLQPR